jgi:hypothetical protein
VGIFNRRNAVVGWLTVSVAKRVLKRKAKDAAPSLDPETRKPNKSAVALLVAGAAGALTFWRKRSGGGDGSGDTADA